MVLAVIFHWYSWGHASLYYIYKLYFWWLLLVTKIL